MDREYGKICCIIMASGLSERYGKNKLLEKLDGREVILRTADSLTEAGFVPVTVTRSPEVKALMDREGIACVLHDGPKKSDTMHAGIRYAARDAAGYLFMPGDQPLVRPASLRRMADRFFRCPEHAVRLGYRDMPGSPVLFPASCREEMHRIMDYFYIDGETADENGREFVSLCEQSEAIRAVLCGHVHGYHEMEYAPGKLQVIGSQGMAGAVHLLTVTG